MGSVCSHATDPADRAHTPSSRKREKERRASATPSRAERQIALNDNHGFKRECKILLLGSGESGKSTILKQIKILHQRGFTQPELLMNRTTILQNMVESAQTLVFGMRKFGQESTNPTTLVFAQQIMDFPMPGSDPTYTLPESFGDAVSAIWVDPVTPSILRRTGAEFYLMDSATYFFTHARRICGPTYIPDQEDVLRARKKTQGICETKFHLGPLSIHMFDIGGQRSERTKWIQCFDSVTSVVFCVALSEYDQVLLEEKSQNRMAESLLLFDGVVNSRWFFKTSIILFLNKTDVFREKLPRSPLARYFPEYTGGADHNKAAKFILWKYHQVNRAKLAVFPHLTQATSTDNIRVVLAAVKETILENALNDAGVV